LEPSPRLQQLPRHIEGGTDSSIEDGRPGDEVGAVRRFHYGEAWIRQRLATHSDAKRAFTYAGVEPFSFPAREGAAAPAPIDYQGTLRLTPVIDGYRTFIEWFVEFESRPAEAKQWTGLLLDLISQWVDSLRRTLVGSVKAQEPWSWSGAAEV
jgi:hypothetical protein